MLKSYHICDYCNEKIERSGFKLVQPVALTPLLANGNSSKRVNVSGVDFCSEACLKDAITAAIHALIIK